MYIEELLSKTEGKRSELSRRLIIEYLKFVAYNDKERLIHAQPKRLIDELDKENSYELDTRLLHNRLAYNFSAQLSIFKLIPKNYPEQMLALFKCIIYQETSMPILSELLNIIKREYEDEYDSFIEILIMRVGKIYNLYRNDSKFVLDLLFLLNEEIHELSWPDVPIFALEEDISSKDRRIEDLTLSIPELDQLPDSIGLLSNLRSLGLFDTSIKELPESIGLLSNLRSLGLSGACIRELPESLGQLSHLKILNLRHTYIKKFPESFINLQELEEFYTPQIFERKKIPQLVITVAKKYISKKYLEKGLDQDEALIMALSEIIFNEGLRKTELDESGHVKGLIFSQEGEYGNLEKARFPEFITDLKFLEKLCFCGYNLSRVPKSISKLKNLKILNLELNKLRSFPSSIESLKNLKVLNLGLNEIKSLPSSIELLKKIESLYLNYIRIKNWDFLKHFSKLKQLSLAVCGLVKIPEVIWSLTSLEYLDLGSNRITQLPKDIGKLKSLKNLYLYGNSLKELPKEIGHLRNLEELQLNVNFITELPATIRSLKSLKKIYLLNNGIKEVPATIKNLKNLEITI